MMNARAEEMASTANGRFAERLPTDAQLATTHAELDRLLALRDAGARWVRG